MQAQISDPTGVQHPKNMGAKGDHDRWPGVPEERAEGGGWEEGDRPRAPSARLLLVLLVLGLPALLLLDLGRRGGRACECGFLPQASGCSVRCMGAQSCLPTPVRYSKCHSYAHAQCTKPAGTGHAPVQQRGLLAYTVLLPPLENKGEEAQLHRVLRQMR